MTLRILVVEDEMTISLLVEDMLTELGHEVVDLAMRLKQAEEMAATFDIDLAILDVNLDGHKSFPSQTSSPPAASRSFSRPDMVLPASIQTIGNGPSSPSRS